VYLELAYRLRNSGDTREPDDVVVFALKAWLGNRQEKSIGGYQWKELFLPDGSELRMRFRGAYYYARIDGDQLKYAGEIFSPRGCALMVPGTVRNPLRYLWIRRGINECWTIAYTPLRPHAERRRHARRATD
jgi:hypothetical protein